MLEVYDTILYLKYAAIILVIYWDLHISCRQRLVSHKTWILYEDLSRGHNVTPKYRILRPRFMWHYYIHHIGCCYIKTPYRKPSSP